APGRGEQPGTRMVGDAVDRPPLHRGGDRVGRHLLGQIQVPQPADERGEQPAPLLTEHRLYSAGRLHARSWSYRCGSSKTRTGLTSTEPRLAVGLFAAQSSAVSRSGTSTT